MRYLLSMTRSEGSCSPSPFTPHWRLPNSTSSKASYTYITSDTQTQHIQHP